MASFFGGFLREWVSEHVSLCLLMCPPENAFSLSKMKPRSGMVGGLIQNSSTPVQALSTGILSKCYTLCP